MVSRGTSAIAPAADDDDADVELERRLSRKVNLVEFVLHEHTLLSLCFASEDSPPPIGVAGCCCVCVDDLGVRHKIFITSFVLVANLSIAMQISLGDHGAFWAFAVTLFVVMPATCFVRSTIVDTSQTLDDQFPWVQRKAFLRCEELLLFGWLAYTVVEAAMEHTVGDAMLSLVQALAAFGAQMCAELLTLLWKYFGCRACCPCCVPKKRDMRRNRNRGAAAEAARRSSKGAADATPVLASEAPPHQGGGYGTAQVAKPVV